MEINLRRIDDAYKMEAVNESGEIAYTDGSMKIGGSESAMRPMQLMLVSLGGCSSIDIISLLKKFRQPPDDIKIRVKGDRDPAKVPSLFESIHIHYEIYGDIEEAKAEKAVRLSMEKYCSVAMIMKESAEINWTFEVIRPN